MTCNKIKIRFEHIKFQQLQGVKGCLDTLDYIKLIKFIEKHVKYIISMTRNSKNVYSYENY